MRNRTVIKVISRAFAVLLVSVAAHAADEPQWLTWPGADAEAPHIVLVSGDEEYRSEEGLPQLAKILSTHHGMKTTVLFAQEAGRPGVINPNHQNNIPGMEMLDSADLAIFQIRFRNLPEAQMAAVDRFLKAGKPLVGIRTATHAFSIKDEQSPWHHYHWKYKGDRDGAWKGGFGRFILGETWIAHHGKHKYESTRGRIAPGAEHNDLLNGISDREIWGPSDVYRVRLPMLAGTEVVLLGEVVTRDGDYDDSDPFFGMRETDTGLGTANEKRSDPNSPLMPIAWSKRYRIPGGEQGFAFTSTIGSSTDMMNEGVRRLLVNAVFRGLALKVPERANVDLVGEFTPSAFRFLTDGEWAEMAPKVSDAR